MAIGSPGAKSDSGADFSVSGAQFVEYEAFIEAQLAKTRSHVRGVDIAAATMVLLAGTVGYFFVAVLIDHWLVSGGLGFWGRTILLVLYLTAGGWWTVTRILPLLLRRINPLYAAQTIEHSRPTLKNALVNFLLFRSDPGAVHQRVYEQIEQQAATSLVGVEVESAVDRSRLVKIGYVLVALVALGAIYALVSPKNAFKTVSRVFMPWADIAPPTSTVIDEIEPGSTQAFRGQQVTVKARVQGLPDGEPVLLYYTTADRQIVDRAVEMARPANEYRHVAVLPAGDSALQQSITYRIVAGDAQSRDYTIEVVSAPTIVVNAIEYKYPAYTGLIGQRVEHQGDLKAIEGTEVALEGLANQPIGKAFVDFAANGSLDLPMRAEGSTARTSFRLGLSEDRQKSEHELYQLIFKNADGQQNPQPVRHRIEVVADLAPEIQFVEPTREEIEVPLDGLAELELVASDPDFLLADIRLVLRHGDKPLVDEKLLSEPWRGQFVKKLRFVPRDHQLAAGEVVEYYAVAVDNKSPRPNRTETSRRRIRITSPTGRNGNDRLAQNDSQGDQDDGEDRKVSPSGGDGQQPRDNEPAEGEPEEQANEPGETRSPEDAAARNERDQQQPVGDQSGEQADDTPTQPSDARNQSGEQKADQNAAGDRKDQSGGDNEPQPGGDEQQASDESGSGEASDGSSQQSAKSGSKQSNKQQGGEESREQQPGGEQGGEQAASGKQQNARSSDDRGQQQGEQGGEQSGKGQSGEQPEQEGVASDGTNDGDAIERILKHRDQQNPEAGDQTGEKSATKDPQNADKPAGEKQGAEQNDGEQQGQQSGDQPRKKPSANQQQGGKQQRGSGQEQGSKSSASDNAQDQNGKQNAGGEQQGAQEKPGGSSGAKSTTDSKSGDSKQEQSSDTNEQASDQQGASDVGERSGDKPGSKQGRKQQPERTPGEGQQATENSSGDKSGNEQQLKDQGDGNQGEQGATRDNNTREDGSPQKTDTQGQGAQSKDDPTRSPQQKPEQSGEQRPDAKGGDGEQEKGQSGAGKKSDDNAGSPRPQESSQPRQKSQQPGSENAEEKPEGNEQSPSTSKRESDSSGEEDGDRSGGGERGGGQKANQSGTGGAGQNTAADEGAGQSDEAGDGDTSNRAGGDRQSQNETGQQGKQPGQGSETKSGAGQEQAGGDQPPSDPTNQPSDSRNSGGEGGGTPGGEQGGANSPKGGNSPDDKPWQPGVDRAADANLEYTRKATDLALEHLKDQLADGQDDSELLKQLGWTREEADAFIQRWEAMRGQSQAPGPKGDAARRELDETLRSLGLRPRGSALRSGGKADDRAAGLQESRRTTPPPEYSEAFKAYTQGTSRGGK